MVTIERHVSRRLGLIDGATMHDRPRLRVTLPTCCVICSRWKLEQPAKPHGRQKSNLPFLYTENFTQFFYEKTPLQGFLVGRPACVKKTTVCNSDVE